MLIVPLRHLLAIVFLGFVTVNSTYLKEFLLGLNEIERKGPLPGTQKTVIKDLVLSSPLFWLLKMTKSQSQSP